MADESNSKEKRIYFQTLVLTFIHPETGDKVTRNFIGKAFFTPEEIQRFGNVEVGDLFHSMELDQPYNPFEDDENVEVHRKLTDAVREALDNDNG